MYSLKHFKHLFPLFLTFFNIAATIVFTIIIVPHIKDINNVGLIRLSVRNIDRCALGTHPSFHNNSAFVDLIHEDSNKCVMEQVDVINQTLHDLSYLNKFPQNMIFGKVNDERIELENAVNNYYIKLSIIQQQIEVLEVLEVFDLSTSNLLRQSNNVVTAANKMNDLIIDMIADVMIAIASMMLFVVLCQIFYNVNTILLKRQKRKQLEMRTEYNALNQVCHEIRNSLFPVDVCIQELIKMNESNQIMHGVQYMNTLMHNMYHIKYILKRRLDYNKILKNEYKINLECVDLFEFIKSYIPTFCAYARELNKDILIDIQDVEHITIEVDTYLMHHVITNILRNAVKYGKDDCVNHITMSSSNQNDKIVLKIDDTGIGGISTNTKHHHIGHNSYGLGIPFVKRIMKIIPGGNIVWIDKSACDPTSCGTIVTICFLLLFNTIDIPIYSFNHNESQLEFASSIEANSSMTEESFVFDWTRRLRLSIIDDCIIVRKCMEHTMKLVKDISWSDISTYINAERFLEERVAFNQFDVLLVDQNMESSGGVMKGTDLIIHMLEKCEFAGLIIAITGNQEDVSQILSKHLSSKKITVWSKPLPKLETIYKTISEFYNTPTIEAAM